MGERGLKRKHLKNIGTEGRVAPYGGAWIETSAFSVSAGDSNVAPYEGAWIETTQIMHI